MDGGKTNLSQRLRSLAKPFTANMVSSEVMSLPFTGGCSWSISNCYSPENLGMVFRASSRIKFGSCGIMRVRKPLPVFPKWK